MTSVHWKGGIAFEALTGSGGRLMMDSSPEHGGQSLGPTPVETLLASVAACSAMDVISILQKKRQKVSRYWVEIEADRAPAGEFPRPITHIRIRHYVEGQVEKAALARAVELSDTKYCTVVATLRTAPVVTSAWQVVKEEPVG